MKKILLVFVAALVAAVAADNKKIVCYWGSWSVYRPGDGFFDPSLIDPKLCTHLIYTFVGLEQNGQVKILDAWNDLPNGGGKNNIAHFNELRKQNPALKTMMAIGGWNEGSKVYSKVVADPNLRRTMVESIVNFVKKYNFDGFDIDWEYPSQREFSSPADKQNYVLLLKELRQRFDQNGYILSAAVGAAESSASQSYIIPEVSKYLHFINLMAYDLHGEWDKKTGFHSAVYPASSESGAHAKLNVDAIIKYWISQGAPAEKLILGIPLYGRSFTLGNEQSNGVGAPATKGSAGPYTREAGMLGYNEICDNIKHKNWQVKYDDEQKSVYAYKGNQWVSYDDEKIVKEKADYIKKYNLGGAMVWSIETDDFRGKCGQKYPLLNTLNRELGSSVSSKPNSESMNQLQNQQGPGDFPDYLSEEDPSDDLNSLPQQPQEPQEPQYPQEPEKPQIPQNPSHNGQVCQTEGYIRDPQNCANFYYCQFYQDNFIEHLFNCPANLLYDTTLGVCNWPEAVQC